MASFSIVARIHASLEASLQQMALFEPRIVAGMMPVCTKLGSIGVVSRTIYAKYCGSMRYLSALHLEASLQQYAPI